MYFILFDHNSSDWLYEKGKCSTDQVLVMVVVPVVDTVCGLLANTEPESNLIKTFPVNIKHITDIHATQDLLQ